MKASDQAPKMLWGARERLWSMGNGIRRKERTACTSSGKIPEKAFVARFCKMKIKIYILHHLVNVKDLLRGY